MLARLIERAHSLLMDDTNSPGDGSCLTDEWDRARARATSPAELAEIDAIFGRHAA
jgi:hypothetical protein